MRAWLPIGALVVALLWGSAAAHAGPPSKRGSERGSGRGSLKGPVRAAEVEPPPAEFEPEPTEVEPEPTEVEPAPAPLGEDPAKRQLADERSRLQHRQRLFGGLGWTGAALTLGLVTSGIAIGVLAQQRSDDLSLLTVQRENGVAPVFDSGQRETYERLQQEGQSLRSATIGCIVAGGVAAVGTGLLFYGQSRAEAAHKKLSLVPIVSGNTTGLALLGSF